MQSEGEFQLGKSSVGSEAKLSRREEFFVGGFVILMVCLTWLALSSLYGRKK